MAKDPLLEKFADFLKEEVANEYSSEIAQIFEQVFAAIETLKERNESKYTELTESVEFRVATFEEGFRERLGTTNADLGNKASKASVESLISALRDFRRETLQRVNEVETSIPGELTGDDIVNKLSLINRQWVPIESVKGYENFVTNSSFENAIIEIGGKLTVMEKRNAKGYGALGGGSEGTGSLFLSRLRDVDLSGLTLRNGKYLLGSGSGSSTLTLTTTGSSGAATYNSGTGVLNIPVYSGGGGASIGGAVTSGTQGSVLFVNPAGTLAQDNANLFYDSTAKQFAIGSDTVGNGNAQTPLATGGSSTTYLQSLTQNLSAGNSSSTDVVASNDSDTAGGPTYHYIDMGINSSTYNDASYTIGGANGGYLYVIGGELSVGTASASDVKFHRGGTLAANEVARFTSSGLTVGLSGTLGGAITLPGATSGTAVLKVAAAAGTGTVFQLPANNGTNTYVLQTDGTGVTSWVPASGGGGTNYFTNSGASTYLSTGTNLGVGTSTPGSRLDVTGSDAGTTITVASDAMMQVTNTNTTNNSFSDYTFNTLDLAAANVATSKIVGVHTVHTAGATSGDMVFLTRNAGTIAEALRITAAKSVYVTSTSSTALGVGANGSTNPALQIDASTASSATGIQIKSAAAGGGVAFNVISSGANEGITLATKGTGGFVFQTNGSTKFAVSNSGNTSTNVTHLYNFTINNTTGARFSVVNSADTSITASTEAPFIDFALNTSARSHLTGALTTQRDFIVRGTTHGFVAASALTNLATFSVLNGNGGTNATVTNNIAIYLPNQTVANSTNGYALWAEATSGATNNYAARFSGVVQTVPVTVASLPSAATAGAGASSFVSDALTPVFGSAVTGGGAVKVPVYSDGTSWIVG